MARYLLKEEDIEYYHLWTTKEAGLKHQREVLEEWVENDVDEWQVDGQRLWVERCEREAKAAKEALMERAWVDD